MNDDDDRELSMRDFVADLCGCDPERIRQVTYTWADDEDLPFVEIVMVDDGLFTSDEDFTVN